MASSLTTILGGFVGDEGNKGDRDPVANETILTGDLDEDDIPGNITQNRGDNSVHVVTGDAIDPPCRMDGFTICGGHADANGEGGGGMEPLTDQEVFECMGITWDEFETCLTNASSLDDANCICWLEHYWERHCLESCLCSPSCPGSDPWGNH